MKLICIYSCSKRGVSGALEPTPLAYEMFPSHSNKRFAGAVPATTHGYAMSFVIRTLWPIEKFKKIIYNAYALKIHSPI